jgi:dihydrofolate reductase
MMKRIIIAAKAKNNVIGKDNDLVWRLPDDMKFFQAQTAGHAVLMGRKNYESIPEKFRPLPHRKNIIITRNSDYSVPQDCEVFGSVEEGIEYCKNEGFEKCFIIGGGQIYKYALHMDLVDEMLLTHVEATPEGDTFFPEFDESKWDKDLLEEHAVDEKHPFAFSFWEYKKASTS